MLKLRHLECFNAVVESGSLSAASEALGISPPALSKSIRSLEDQLGTELFDRKGRVLRLTPFGEEFTPEARRMVAQADNLHWRAQAFARGELGSIRIGSGPLPRQLLLAAALAKLPEKQGRLRIEVVDGSWPELAEGLIDHTYDFIVVDPDDVDIELQKDVFAVRRLEPISIFLYCRADHPKLGGDRFDNSAVLENRWASPRIPLHYLTALRQQFDPNGKLSAATVRRIYRLPDIRLEDFHACLRLAQSTDILAPAPRSIAAPLLAAGLVEQLPQFEFQTHVGIITNTRRSAFAGAAALMEAIAAVAAAI